MAAVSVAYLPMPRFRHFHRHSIVDATWLVAGLMSRDADWNLPMFRPILTGADALINRIDSAGLIKQGQRTRRSCFHVQ